MKKEMKEKITKTIIIPMKKENECKKMIKNSKNYFKIIS